MLPAIAAACTPPLPTITPYPVDAATQVPVNTTLLFEHRSAVVDATTVTVTANGNPVAGAFDGLAGEDHGLAAWTRFTPSGQLPVGSTVTVVLSTQYYFAGSQSTFQVGGSADNDAPTGGDVVGASSFAGDLSGTFGYTISFDPASDPEGPSWIHVSIVGPDGSTRQRVLDGTSTGVDGGASSCSDSVGEGDVTVTSYAFDLAGNKGPETTYSFHVGPDSAGWICEVGSGGSPWAGVLLLVGAVLASRRPGRRVSQRCDRRARSGSSGAS